MPHVSGHKGQTGLMSNPYQQAAESMQQAGLSGVGDVGAKERKKTSDLDEITLMTQAMSDELNSRIAASRTSDKFSIATTLVTTGIGLKELSLNKQHKKILEKQLERETKKIKGFTYNKRTGNFTSRRDLFAHNPTSWGMSAWKSEKGSMMWKNRWWKKYGRDLGGNY